MAAAWGSAEPAPGAGETARPLGHVNASARLLLAPLVLVIGMLACAAIPPRAPRLATGVAAAALVIQLGALLSVAQLVLPQGALQAPAFELVSGVDLSLRADPAALAILLLTSAFALLWVAEPERTPAERAALLLCLLGTDLAALAGNLVLLFGGLELANVGAFLLGNGGPSHAGPQQRAGFILNHSAALFLLVAAVRVQTDAGTSDLLALPAFRVQNGLAACWALAGAVRLVAPFGLPRPRDAWGSPAWATIAAVPTGALVLLRLVQVSNGVMPAPVVFSLCGAGVVIALGGAAFAVGDHARPQSVGRWLCVAAAGPLIVLAGLPSAAAPAAFAVGFIALFCATATAPLWLRPHPGDAETPRLRALGLLMAGALPLGAGFVGMLVATATAAALGVRGLAITTGLAIAWTGSAVAAALAVRTALATPPTRHARHRALLVRTVRLGLPGLAAALLSGAVAVFPGKLVAWFVEPLAGGGAPGVQQLDLAAVRGPGGGWAGGYLLPSALLVAGATWSTVTLLRGRLVTVAGGAVAPPPPGVMLTPMWARLRSLWKVGVEPLERLIDRLDAWSVHQPNLVTALFITLACLYIFR